jgi:hypothetical protein
MSADGHPRQNYTAMPKPALIADMHWPMFADLATDWHIWIVHAVVGVGHEHTLPEPDIVAYDDRLVGGDCGTVSNHAPLPDDESASGHEVL